MFKKLGLFLFVLSILQVSARYRDDIPDLIDDEINDDEPASLSSSRIVSGWLAEPGQHPHHAALQMRSASGVIRVCGGSLISNEWVLTAARCVVSRVRAVVRLGVVNINDNNPNNIYETSEWYTHPNFNNLSTALQSHGVTLLKLPRPVVYSWLVKPIRLQSSADAYRNYDGEQVYASGHGRTSTFGSPSALLRWVYLRAISNEQCERTYTNSVIFNTIICAQYFNVTSQSTCFDDNGGPLVHVGSDGIPTLIGITHFFPSTSTGCDVGRPTGFYRPGAFLPWIKEVTGIDFDTNSKTTITPSTTTTTITTTPTTTTPTTTTPTTTIPTTTTPTTTTPTSTNPTTTTTTTTTTPTTTTPFTTTPTTTTTPATTTTTTSTTIPSTTTPTTTTPYTTGPTTATTNPIPTTIPSITTAPPDDEEEDSDTECNDDDMGQLQKRLQVDVKVKVALNKYKVMKINDTSALHM